MAYREPIERVALMTKDGAWHVLEEYAPTDEDRQRFPVSYPPGDAGPFYRWTERGYETIGAALLAVEALDSPEGGS